MKERGEGRNSGRLRGEDKRGGDSIWGEEGRRERRGEMYMVIKGRFSGKEGRNLESYIKEETWREN